MPNYVFVILYFSFLKVTPKIVYKLQSPQHLNYSFMYLPGLAIIRVRTFHVSRDIFEISAMGDNLLWTINICFSCQTQA
jgi:hypothetical protein